MKKEKIIKWSKALDGILKIIQIITLLFVPVSILGICFLVFAPLPTISNYSLMLGELRIVYIEAETFVKAFKNAFDMKIVLLLNFLLLPIMLIIIWYCIKVFRSIIAPMKLGHPFEQGISKKIFNSGLVVLISGLFINIQVYVYRFLLLRSIDLNTVLNKTISSNATLNFRFRTDFIFFSLGLFFMSFIFAYGEELQKESDELL